MSIFMIFLTTGCANKTAIKNEDFDAKQSCAQNKSQAEENIKDIENINTNDSLFMNEVIFNKKSNSCIYSYRIYRNVGENHKNGIYDYFSNKVIFSCEETANISEKAECQINHYDKVEELKK